MTQHIRLMARYNKRMNSQIYQCASHLSEEQIKQDRGAFFGSILGTLNHILIGDLIWLSRLATHSPHFISLQALSTYPTPSGLNDILYPDLNELREARFGLDQTIEQWSEEISEEDMGKSLRYSNTKGIASERNFEELVHHLFNHQTHHRGQVSTLLFQVGEDIGITDFLMDIPDLLSQ